MTLGPNILLTGRHLGGGTNQEPGLANPNIPSVDLNKLSSAVYSSKYLGLDKIQIQIQEPNLLFSLV